MQYTAQRARYLDWSRLRMTLAVGGRLNPNTTTTTTTTLIGSVSASYARGPEIDPCVPHILKFFPSSSDSR